MKHSRDYMQCVLSLLAWQQSILNLLPHWIAGKRDKQIWFSEISTYCHSVLVLLSHMTWTADKSRREDYLLTQTLWIFLQTSTNSILETTVQIDSQLFLVHPLKITVIGFDTNPCIN